MLEWVKLGWLAAVMRMLQGMWVGCSATPWEGLRQMGACWGKAPTGWSSLGQEVGTAPRPHSPQGRFLPTQHVLMPSFTKEGCCLPAVGLTFHLKNFSTKTTHFCNSMTTKETMGVIFPTGTPSTGSSTVRKLQTSWQGAHFFLSSIGTGRSIQL